MHAEIVSIDISSDWHGLETLNELLIDLLLFVLLEDLLSESEMLCHGAALVVTTQHDNGVGVVNLETEEEDAYFKGVDSSVYVVTEEEQVRAMKGNRERKLVRSKDILTLARPLGRPPSRTYESYRRTIHGYLQ